MKVLITGAAGFTGRRLAAVMPGDVFAATRDHADLTDAVAVRALLASVHPAAIFHLAGGVCGTLEDDYVANIITTENVLGAVRDLCLPCRVLLVGSAAEYGPAHGRIAETAPLRPVSAYGLIKVCQTFLMRAFDDLDLVMARTFNLTGDGQSTRLLAGRVAAWVAAGKPGRLRLGALDAVRDYLPVEEAAAAYIRIARYGTRGEVYNVGSGQPVLIRDLVCTLAGDLDLVDEEPGAPGVGGAAGEVVADVSKLEALPC